MSTWLPSLWLRLKSWLIKISKYFHMDWCLISDFPITVITRGNPGLEIDVATCEGRQHHLLHRNGGKSYVTDESYLFLDKPSSYRLEREDPAMAKARWACTVRGRCDWIKCKVLYNTKSVLFEILKYRDCHLNQRISRTRTGVRTKLCAWHQKGQGVVRCLWPDQRLLRFWSKSFRKGRESW